MAANKRRSVLSSLSKSIRGYRLFIRCFGFTPAIVPLEPHEQLAELDGALHESEAAPLAAPERGAAPLHEVADLLAMQTVPWRKRGEGVVHALDPSTGFHNSAFLDENKVNFFHSHPIRA